MSEPKPKMIFANVTEFSVYSLDGYTLREVIDMLEGYAKSHGDTAKIDWGRHDRWSESESFAIQVERLENEKELAERVAREAKWKMEQDERDRREFERLKKLLGDKA